MVDQSKLKVALKQYKEQFVDVTWPAEKYKWQAVKCFQDNWQIDAPDFAEMLRSACAATSNLLASAGSFPLAMIRRFATADPERTRAMFVALFDESVDLVQRMTDFKQQSLAMMDLGFKGAHFQDENTISTYLWLRYPDKYYIYKWSECREVSQQLSAGYRFKRGDYANNVRDQFALYNAICEQIHQDAELCSMFETALTDDCYPDPKLKTLTIDVGFFMSRQLRDTSEESEWWPTPDVYHPGLSVEDWTALLQNDAVFSQSSLEVVERFKAVGGHASCLALSQAFGRHEQFYNSNSTALAKRVVRETGCPTVSDDGSENARWWPVLYTGRETTSDEVGSYVWRLRDELSEALEHVDLSEVKRRAGQLESETRNYWWLTASPKQEVTFSSLAVGEVAAWTLLSASGAFRRIHQNYLDARPGDLVIGYESNPVKQIVALGHIAASQDGEQLWFEKSEGLVAPIDLAAAKDAPELATMQAFANNLRGSLFKLTEVEYNTILDMVRDANPQAASAGADEYSKQDFLAEVFMTEADHDRLKSALTSKLNVILQGAPGVGKTFAAQRLAWSMMGEIDTSRVEFVQFHQNYSYEDFMMGYKPTEDGFALRDGIFFRFCKKAANQPDKPYFFIIDEINRGNMSKIFGELLMLIERDYRGEKATLAYSGNQFSVPKNVHIIGMMNTADRSLAMIDYALRRRFSFITMHPGFDSEGFKQYQARLADETFDQLVVAVQSLNEEITRDPSLGPGFCIGHSYFCGQSAVTDGWLHGVVEFDIVPMLDEYWFDEPAKVDRWRAHLLGVLQT